MGIIFQKMLIEDISDRLVRWRQEKGISQQDMIDEMNEMIRRSDKFGLEEVDQSRISNLENKRIKKTNSTFITDSYLQVYAIFFKKEKSEILYGDREYRKSIMEKFYYKIAYNFNVPRETRWDEKISYDKQLEELQSTLVNVMFSNAEFSYIYNKKKIESVSDYGIFNMVIIDFSPEEEKIFDDTIEMFKEIICELLLESFDKNFVNIENVKLSSFDNTIIKWFNKDVKKRINQLISEMNNDELLSMGFQINTLLKKIYEDSSKELWHDLNGEEENSLFVNLNLLNNDEVRNSFFKGKNKLYFELAGNLTKLQAKYVNNISLKKYLSSN